MNNKILAVKIIGSIVLGVTLSARALAADEEKGSGAFFLTRHFAVGSVMACRERAA